MSDGRIISGQLFTAFDEETKGTSTLATLVTLACAKPMTFIDECEVDCHQEKTPDPWSEATLIWFLVVQGLASGTMAS